MEAFREVIALSAGHGITFATARDNRPMTALLEHYGSNRHAMAAYREEHPGNAATSSEGRES